MGGPCENYTSWMDHGVNINECLEFYQGKCGEPMSPHASCDCPWSGYPCPADDGEGRWKAPERVLVENVAMMDNAVED